MRLLLVVFSLAFLSTSVNAATYRVSISGYVDSFSFSCLFHEICTPVTITDPSQLSGSDGFNAYFGDLLSGQGSMIVEAEPISGQQTVSITQCNGMLRFLCGDTSADLATGSFSQVSSLGGVFSYVNPFEFGYFDDSGWGFTYEGEDYFTQGGANFVAYLDSYSLTEVPLPASWSLLLAALLSGAWVARKKRQSA